MKSTLASAYTQSTNFLSAIFTDVSTGTVDDYLWDFGDGNTSTQASPTHAYADSGTYTVCLTVSNDCGDDTECQSVTVDVLIGIQEVGEPKFILYPNPTDRQFTIELSGLEGQGTLNLMDMAGRMVYSNSVTLTENFKRTLNLHLATGSYIFQLQSKEGITHKKLEI